MKMAQESDQQKNCKGASRHTKFNLSHTQSVYPGADF